MPIRPNMKNLQPRGRQEPWNRKIKKHSWEKQLPTKNSRKRNREIPQEENHQTTTATYINTTRSTHIINITTTTTTTRTNTTRTYTEFDTTKSPNYPLSNETAKNNTTKYPNTAGTTTRTTTIETAITTTKSSREKIHRAAVLELQSRKIRNKTYQTRQRNIPPSWHESSFSST